MTSRHRIVVVSTLAVLSLSASASACGSSESDTGEGGEDGEESTTPSTEISGSVKEWSVSVGTASAPAGDVSFTIENAGTIGHEFLIVKTDIAPGEIPLDGDHFPEDAEGIEVIDEIGEYPEGTTETLDVTLDAGSYQLVCNLPGHYDSGMFIGFVVDA